MALPVLNATEGTQFPLRRQMRENVVAALKERPYGTLISYGELSGLVGMDATENRARQSILLAGRDLLKEHQRLLVNERALGYRIVQPNQHVAVSRGLQAQARRRLKRGLAAVVHVAMDHLTPDEINAVVQEQTRVGVKLALDSRLSKTKALPPKQDLKLPSGGALVEFMRRRVK